LLRTAPVKVTLSAAAGVPSGFQLAPVVRLSSPPPPSQVKVAALDWAEKTHCVMATVAAAIKIFFERFILPSGSAHDVVALR
jgi:hypothetical protein